MKNTLLLCFFAIGLFGVDACNTEKPSVTNAEVQFEVENDSLQKYIVDIPDQAVEIEQNRQIHSLEDAILKEDAEAVRYFLEVKKTGPNQKTSQQEPLLVLATRRGFADAVSQLLAAGANVNEKDSQGHTALRSLAQEDYYWSDKVDYDTVLSMLLQAKANVNAQDNQGQTALMVFSYTGDNDAVEKLLAGGADTNIKDNQGNTALKLAQQARKQKTIELLRKAGAIQ